MGSVWDHFGVNLGSFWERFGIFVGSIVDHLGSIFVDCGIILRSKPTGGSGQNDWQIVNHASTGDLRFYAYGLAGFALTLDREDGNATFGASNFGVSIEM